jgi:hypothetical protein
MRVAMMNFNEGAGPRTVRLALDDFRFKHRMPSRAATIRELLRQGLGVASGDSAITSREYGVLNGPPLAVGRRRRK